MNIKKLVLFCVILGIAVSAAAQGQWTLDSCINYALERNISLQQSRLSAESAEVDVYAAKGQLLPNLSFSTQQSLINRPYQESSSTVSGSEILTTNAKTSYTGNYGLNAGWTVYEGSINRNTVKQNKISSEISQLDVENTANSIQESIVQNYMQILYAIESVRVNENTLETSTAQRDRGRELFNVGSISKVDLAQLEAQVSQDNYQLVSSKTQLANYRLQLKQLLEIEGDYEMELYVPEIDDGVVLSLVQDKQSVYLSALDSRPEIAASRLNLDASQLAIKIAKGGYIPRISLSAGISTNHTSGTDFNFTEQLKRGWNNTLGLTISVPIASNRQNKSAVQRAQIQYKNSELDLAQQEKDLYQKIEGYWLDAISYQQQYVAAKDNTASAETSYELVTEQFNHGLVSTIDLLQEKNNFLSAQQQLLQAKYMAVMSRLLLRFYAGGSLSID
ncbi:MAG: TolC family protein [Bacteroidales bacterium]|nr:TolC family protein [Bacteroidales bacterium]